MNAQADSSAEKPLALAVLISGGGRSLVNLANEIAAGRVNARIHIVISSREDAGGIERARELGLPVVSVPRKAFADTAEFSKAIWAHVRNAGSEFVCLAGFLSLITIPDDFAHKVINIHPALLPSFGGPGMYGQRVHQAVIDHGCKVSGCTVHFADQTYDTGAIIVQRTCAVHEDDDASTLAARVFEQECIALPEAVELIAQKRVVVEGNRAKILPPKG